MLLSDQATKFLTLLKQYSADSRWLSRSEIATLTGKKRLNPYEVAAINLLAENGLIECVREDMPGAIGYQWKYRIPLTIIQNQTEKENP